MKLLNFFHEGAVRTGLLGPHGVVDLAAADLWQGSAPVKIDDIDALRSKINLASLPARSLNTLRFAPPVVAPEKIICVGLNYRRHALEAGFPIPTTPVIFGKFANSLVGSGSPVALPRVDTRYDFEAELGVIIGRTACNVTVEAALDYVSGYCCANDLSARGAQLATSQWMIGKMLDGFLPLGPYLVTTDAIRDPQTLGVRCRVNGELMQESSTSDMIFSVAELIAFLSRYATLKPGDLIVTGTPEGVLLGKEAPIWLTAGDEVVVEIDELGTLTNLLVASQASV
jgi:2-keto-4-pentenoate hydratase/2-oxohepta-3-ene-1,7-dioic acid hydratase in catechol pathway